MTKSHPALRLGGVSAIALALLLILSACAENSLASGDSSSASGGKAVIDDYSETVELFISGPLSSRSLTVTNESYDLSYSESDLYWTYTAVKTDGYFTSGQTDSETWFSSSSDEDGNVTVDKGLPESLPGVFSVGDWVFTFNAYTSSEMSTDYLYYQGVGTSVSLSLDVTNTVSVVIQLYEAVGDTGYLVLKDIGLPASLTESHAVIVTAVSSDGTETVSDTMAYTYDEESSSYTVSSGEDDDADIEGETGYVMTLASGLYTVTIDVYTYVDGSLSRFISIETGDVLIKTNLETTITGDLDASDDSDVTFYVSSADALTTALSTDATVQLESDIALESYLSITSDTTIDLNGQTMTAEDNFAFIIEEGASLTVSGGTVEAQYLFYLYGDNTSLTIEDGTYETDSSNGGYYIVYIPSGLSDVEVTINDGSFESNDWTSICAYSGTVNINGGEFSGDYNIMVYPGSNTTYNITGGEFNADYYTLYVSGEHTSTDDNVEINISGGTFNGEAFLSAGYASTSITGGTFYGTDGMQALHVKAGAVSITGGSFYHADYYSDSDRTDVNESYSTSMLDYDYFFTGSGSMNHDEAIVIEANPNYEALTSVTLGDGFTSYSGVLYVINPDYDTSTKGTITESISSGRTDIQTYTIEDLIYKRAVSGYGTAYFTDLEKAKGYATDLEDAEIGDLYVYSDGSWTAYSDSDEG